MTIAERVAALIGRKPETTESMDDCYRRLAKQRRGLKARVGGFVEMVLHPIKHILGGEFDDNPNNQNIDTFMTERQFWPDFQRWRTGRSPSRVGVSLAEFRAKGMAAFDEPGDRRGGSDEIRPGGEW